jgi:hypothetical protein
MKCGTCGGFIPNNLLSCPNCALVRSRQGIENQQAEILRKIVAENGEVRVVRTRKAGERHVQMFAVGFTFCWSDDFLREKSGWVPYQDALTKVSTVTCAQCRINLKRAIDTAKEVPCGRSA